MANALPLLPDSALPHGAARILLVDRSGDEGGKLRGYLESSALRIAALEIVDSLRSAIEQAARGRYHIILLDARLPDGNGVTALADLRAISAGTPIVVLASLEDAELGIEAVRHGAQDYAVKQHLNPAALERIVRYALEREQYQRAISAAQESCRALFMNVPVALFGIAYDGTLLAGNPALLKLLAIDDTAVFAARGLRSFFADAAAYTSLLETLSQRGRVSDVEIALLDADGRRVDALLSCVPIQGEDAPRGWEGCITDISGLKRAERERERLERELRMAQKLETIGQLAAGLAQEIDTPTQYIHDNLRFLTEVFEELAPLLRAQPDLLDLGAAAAAAGDAERYAACAALFRKADVAYVLEELPAALQQSRFGVEQIRKFVTAMKQFARADGDGTQPVDINAAVENALTVSRNEWKYVADVELDLDPRVRFVPCIAASLNQLLLDRIVTAAHVIGDKPERAGKETIKIRTRAAASGATIDVLTLDHGDTITVAPGDGAHALFSLAEFHPSGNAGQAA